jgi:uncharacterized membrane protein YccC
VLLDRIADTIMTGSDADQLMARSLRELRTAEAGFPTGGEERSGPAPEGSSDARDVAHAPAHDRARLRHVHALCGQLAAAARNAGRASTGGALRAEQEDLRLPRAVRPQSPASILIASITPESAAFRHAVRTAICLAIAEWIGRGLALFSLSHGYWIPMTVAIVLRADYGATFSYGLLRVAGTVTGLLLTTGLLHFLPADPWVRLAVMAVLCAGFRYFGAVHYGAAVTALTGMVVLLLALAGEAAAPTMVSRLIATVVGSAMALAAYGVWPTRERERIHTSLGRLLRAYAAYLTSLGTGPAGESQDRREARNAVRVARANAEAGLGRLLAEPATTTSVAELARSLLTNSNRLARTTMTLDAVLGTPGSVPQAGLIESLLSEGAGALEQIAQAVEKKAPPVCISPRLRASQRSLAGKLRQGGDVEMGGELAILCDRLVDNINTLAHIVARAVGASD